MIHARTHENALWDKAAPPWRWAWRSGPQISAPHNWRHTPPRVGSGARRQSPAGRAAPGRRVAPRKRKTRPYPNGKSHDASPREITTDAAKPEDLSCPVQCTTRRNCRPSILQQGSLPAFRINDDGDGAIVGQTDLHVRAKFAGLNAPAQILSQPADELLVKRNRHFRPG